MQQLLLHMGSQMLLCHGVVFASLIFVCVDPLCHFLCCSFCPVSLCSLRPLAFVMLLLPSSGFHTPLLFVLLLALLPSFVCSFLCLLPLWSFRAWPVTPFLMPFSDITSNSQDGHSSWSTLLQMLENGWAFRQLFRLSPEMIQHTCVALSCSDVTMCLSNRSFLYTLNFRVAFQH